MSLLTLLKDTSLITVIGGKEMTYAAKAVIAKTYQGLFPLFAIALLSCCWSCCFPAARCA